MTQPIDTILLLTDAAACADLAPLLQGARPELAPGVQVERASALNEVEAAIDRALEAGGRLRVISFCSPLILPAALLARLHECGFGPAYNVHPGPPEYPGVYPSVFALYAGERRFGTTVHEMVAAVDAGPIVAVERFAMPNPADRWTLDAVSLRSALRLFGTLAPVLADLSAPLAQADEVWSGNRWTRADFRALCELPPNVDAAEFQRRYRAVGEGPNHALSIRLFGHRFALDNQHDPAAATRGGR